MLPGDNYQRLTKQSSDVASAFLRKPPALGVIALTALLSTQLLAWILYGRFLHCFFIYDEVPVLREFSPEFTSSYFAGLAPAGHGFWRPINHFGATLLVSLFGYSPSAFHGASIALHGLVGFLTWLAARRVLDLGYGLAALGAFLFVVHVGAYGAVIQYSNSSDQTLAAGLLLAWIGWDRFLKVPDWRAWACLLVGALVGFMSKETAVMFPGVLIIWTVAKQDFSRKAIAVLAALVMVTAVYVGWVYWCQKSGNSHLSTGRAIISPKLFIRQFADHASSMIFPYLHVIAPPFVRLSFPHWALWLLRLLFCAAFAVAIWALVRSSRWRSVAALTIMATLPIAPVSVLADPPQARYIYAGLPFFALAIIQLCRVVRPLVAYSVTAILSLVYIAGLIASPTLRGYKTVCAEVESLVNVARQQSQSWPRGGYVVIWDHPFKTAKEHRWSYCQLLFDLFIPGHGTTVCLDAYPTDGKPYTELTGWKQATESRTEAGESGP